MLNSETELLKLYKQYDYLNQNREHPLIKILVSYIKPSFLFKSEILTPIHLGRAVERDASKDGTISDEDIKWLHENCIGDDDFEGNISYVNRRVGFLTGTYWAWKNYEKLGNPEYFGSFGYRRLLLPNFFNNITQYDVILPEMECMCERSLKTQMQKYHGSKLYNIMLESLAKIYPTDKAMFVEYMKRRNGYFREIYIMKKQVFFEFCNWIFPLLFDLLDIPKDSFELNFYELKKVLKKRKETKEQFFEYKKREIAFIIERLTGFFLYKLISNSKYKCLTTSIITTTTDSVIQNKVIELQNNIQQLKWHIDKRDINTWKRLKYKIKDITFMSERIIDFFLNKLRIVSKYRRRLITGISGTTTDSEIQNKITELQENMQQLKMHIDKRNLNNKDNILTTSNNRVKIISVVNDYKIYNKYLRNNPFLANSSNIEFIDYDNTQYNVPVTERYNVFLDNYNEPKDSWIIFCHQDWEISDDLLKLLDLLDKNKIYGPVGAKLINLNSGIYRAPSGFVYEVSKDNKNIKLSSLRTNYTLGDKADTLDCLALFVHSSLIKKYNLRFDENLKWDLYVEDFCINANKNFNIPIETFYIESTHHSDAGFRNLPLSYYMALEYIRNKYPNDIYAGTCSFMGGKFYCMALPKNEIFYKIIHGII